MAVRVVMVPGWDRKVMRAAEPKIALLALRVEANAMGNIVGGGHVVTGALVGSVRTTREGLAHYRVWIGTDHWHYIEYGTRSHIIRPRGPYRLRFVQHGQLRYAWSVRHPGNREYAVMRRALGGV
jgi:hypothetical protein